MTQYFQVVQKNQSFTHSSQQNQSIKASYLKAQQKFINQSYGYYTEIFLKEIFEQSSSKYPSLLNFHLKKHLREISKKFMMSDLEIIFFAYFAELHHWNYQHKIIKRYSKIAERKESQEDYCPFQLLLFMNFIAYFVKMYIGDQGEVKIIKEFVESQMNNFDQIYAEWMHQNPRECFTISPRQLNLIYSKYSKDCQKKDDKINYNQMVEKILELSTTYSMMPSNNQTSRTKQNGKKKLKRQANLQSKSVNISKNSSSRVDRSSLQSIVETHKDHEIQEHAQHKKITLRNKNKTDFNAVNSNVTKFFQEKESNIFQEFRPDNNSNNQINQMSFFDWNMRSMRSSKYEQIPIPFPLRSNSNISHLL